MNWQIIAGAILIIGGFANISSDFGAFAFGILGGAFLAYWGLVKKGVFKSPIKLASQKLSVGSHADKSATYYLAGVSYYDGNIRKIAIPNPAWNYSEQHLMSRGLCEQIIYRYKLTSKVAELRDEPTNPHDPNAIAVYMEGLLIGYIKSEDVAEIKNIRKKHTVASVIGNITGGEYMIFHADGEKEKDIRNFSINISIQYS